jgi:hypothetical protein
MKREKRKKAREKRKEGKKSAVVPGNRIFAIQSGGERVSAARSGGRS